MTRMTFIALISLYRKLGKKKGNESHFGNSCNLWGKISTRINFPMTPCNAHETEK
jgi:hypothetical protein